MIIIPIKWLFHWEYTLFSDKPSCDVGWYRLTSLDNLRILSPTAGRVMRSYFCAKEAEGGRGVTSHLSWLNDLYRNRLWHRLPLAREAFQPTPRQQVPSLWLSRHEHIRMCWIFRVFVVSTIFKNLILSYWIVILCLPFWPYFSHILRSWSGLDRIGLAWTKFCQFWHPGWAGYRQHSFRWLSLVPHRRQVATEFFTLVAIKCH